MPKAWKSFSEGLARSTVPRAYPGTLPSKSATLKAVESVHVLISSPMESAAHDDSCSKFLLPAPPSNGATAFVGVAEEERSPFRNRSRGAFKLR